MGIKVSKNSITNVLKKHDLYPTGGENNWEERKGKFCDHIGAADFFFVETVKELSCMVFILARLPNMNAIVEHNIQSIRLEMTDHIRARDATELQKLLDEYKICFNYHRPHQGIGGMRPKAFSNGEKHPDPISIKEIKSKKLKRNTFANGIA